MKQQTNMDNILKHQGLPVSLVKEDLKKSLDESRSVYFQRLAGYTHLWSATTRCGKCGAWWMWGIKNNLDFVCDKCK